MIFIFYFSWLILFLYAALLLWLASGYLRTRIFKVKRQFETLPVTIIICARNEAHNISLCLKTLILQDYPMDLVELILVNDASTDRTLQEAELVLHHSRLPYRIISNKEKKGKKESITLAMRLARDGMIILRDADTFAPSKNWLRALAGFYQQSHPDLIIAPVVFDKADGLLAALQQTENSLLQMVTAGSAFYQVPFLCNGANLAFSKKTFDRVGGFNSSLHLEGGDDIFFLEDVKKIPDVRIVYLKAPEALIETYPARTFKQLLRQRVRWASKFKYNRNKLNLFSATLIGLVNLLWLFWCVMSIAGGAHCVNALMLVSFKLVIDLLLLFLSQANTKNKSSVMYTLPVALLYPFYACTVAFVSVFEKPRWKK